MPGHFGDQLGESENCICLISLYSLLAASFVRDVEPEVLPVLQKLQLICGGGPDTAEGAVDLSPGSPWREGGEKLRCSWPGWLDHRFDNYLSSAFQAGGEERDG